MPSITPEIIPETRSELARFQRQFAEEMALPQRRAGGQSSPAFAIYRNTYRKGLTDTLRALYPVVAALIGEQAFETLAGRYVLANPALSPVLTDYGAMLAQLIPSTPFAKPLPYLADVASLEWTIAGVRNAAAVPPLAVEFFATLTPAEAETVALALSPAASLFRSKTPAVTIWTAHQDSDRPDGLAPEWMAEPAIIVQRADRIHVQRIDEPLYRFAKDLAKGVPLGQAALRALAEDAETDLPQFLTRIAQSGAFVPRTPGETPWSQD
jgi:hypothetical protein